MNKAFCVALVVVLTAFVARAHAGDARIGYADEFDTMKGWSSGKDCKLSTEDGIGVFHTSVGSWMNKFKWKGEPFDSIAGGGTWAAKGFGVIDLDKYHYLVIKTVEKGPVCRTHFCGRELQTTVTTGILAQDLAPLGITGKQEAKISFELGNNNTAVKIDYIRLVSDLTDEQKKGLLPNPIRLKKEGIKRVPYDRLEALNERAARPFLAEIPEEKCAFLDPGTGTRKWRMTATEQDENSGSEYSGSIWGSDGSYFYVLGRRAAPIMHYRYDKDAFVPSPVRLAGDSEYTYRWQWLRKLYKPAKTKGGPGFKTFAILRRSNRTGKEDEIARIETWEPWEFTEWKVLPHDICVFALREGKTAWIVYAGETDPKKRLREIKLPTRLKGFSYDPATQTARWFRCYTYEAFCMDLKTGKTTHAAQHTYGHGSHGRDFNYGTVSGYVTAAGGAKGIVMHGAGSTPGDKVRVAGIYLENPATDYGSITLDNRYAITDGVGGELDLQHVMIDLADGATLLRLCTHWTSYANWTINTRSGASPDYTKVVYMSDMLGNGDYYFVITRNPDPPRHLAAKRTGAAVELTWEKPARCLETKGYNVYRSGKSGRDFLRINKEPIKALLYKDEDAPATAFYLVAAEEHSGLEGHFSNEASADYDKAKEAVLHFDAVNCEKTLPLREVLGGGAPYYRYLRVTPSMHGEKTGSVILNVHAPKAGPYSFWARVRNNTGKKGGFSLSGDATIPVHSKEWTWGQTDKPVVLKKGVNRIALGSDTEDDCIERIIVSSLKAYTPRTFDDRKTALPAAPDNLQAANVTANSVQLSWTKSKDIDFDHWSVYVSRDKEFACGNETILQSGRKNLALDWGIRPDTTYYYKVVAYDKRGNASKPTSVAVKTKPLDVVSIKATPKGLTPGESQGVKYVAGAGEATYNFDLKKNGTYYLWLKYSPRSPGKGQKLTASLDAKSGGFAVRSPGRLGRKATFKPGEEPWYLDRVRIGSPEDAYALTAGAHTLRLKLPKAGPWISTLYITNDPSFTPPGYDPRVELKKRFKDA